MTDLDKRLQELALKDWPRFVETIGEEALIAAKVCLLRREGKSYAQIANRLDITDKQARGRCNRCE